MLNLRGAVPIFKEGIGRVGFLGNVLRGYQKGGCLRDYHIKVDCLCNVTNLRLYKMASTIDLSPNHRNAPTLRRLSAIASAMSESVSG